MEDKDYESLPASSTTRTHMLAGAAAGVMEHCIMYPVDCVKTRMQCLVPDPRANYRNVADALYQIVRHEGVKNTVRGINVMIAGAGPAHALYFACYEKLKAVLYQYAPGNKLTPGFAGIFATVLHDAIMNPAEVIKQRMQVFNSPYSSCMECGRVVLKQEGAKAFYRSFTTQLTMNIPFQSTHFVFYELSQDYYNKRREYNPSSHCISGAIAGGVASAVTTPLDVCKTLLNTQERCAISKSNSAITGMVQAARTIYEYRGCRGFLKGLTARIIYQAPSTAISWSVYEFFKFVITKRNQSVNCDGYVTSPVSSVQVHAVSSR